MAEDKEKPDEETSSPAVEAPEVEAEIVTDDDVVIASAEINDGFSGENEAPPTSHPPKKTTLPPRVIFLGVGIIAVFGAGFAVWRLLPGEAQPVLPADIISEQEGQQSVETPEAILDEIPSPSEQVEAAPSAASKITNDIDIGAAAKEAGLDTAQQSPSADETFLPPLPSTEKIEAGNQSLQDAAKEALGMSGPLAGDGENSDTRSGEEQSDSPVFEIEDAVDPAPSNLQQEATGPEEVNSTAADAGSLAAAFSSRAMPSAILP